MRIVLRPVFKGRCREKPASFLLSIDFNRSQVQETLEGPGQASPPLTFLVVERRMAAVQDGHVGEAVGKVLHAYIRRQITEREKEAGARALLPAIRFVVS